MVSSPRYAAKGGRVTLTVYPEEGYTLSELTVTSAQGRDVSLRELEDGRFSFTMPGGRDIQRLGRQSACRRPSGGLDGHLIDILAWS